MIKCTNKINLNDYIMCDVVNVVLSNDYQTYDIEVDQVNAFEAKNPYNRFSSISHNSAMISLSNLTDERMRGAKNGSWWETNPHRALSNNSAAYTEKPEMGTFMREWLSLYDSKSGERGIFSRVASQNQAKKFGRRDHNYDFGTNPCSEIILRPNQFCNLTEVIVRGSDSINDLKRKVRLATSLGTLQSSLTKFPYLRKSWTNNTEEERLLGVSMTGIMDNALTNGLEDTDKLKTSLEMLREVAVASNKQFAEEIGIPQSTAVTCVKPSGCTTLETKIITTDGIKTMAEIFSNIPNINIFELPPGTWLDIKENIYVYDENNDIQKITKLFINGISEVYQIEDINGHVYKFTGNHKLKTLNGWKRVDELIDTDEIVSF